MDRVQFPAYDFRLIRTLKNVIPTGHHSEVTGRLCAKSPTSNVVKAVVSEDGAVLELVGTVFQNQRHSRLAGRAFLVSSMAGYAECRENLRSNGCSCRNRRRPFLQMRSAPDPDGGDASFLRRPIPETSKSSCARSSPLGVMECFVQRPVLSGPGSACLSKEGCPRTGKLLFSVGARSGPRDDFPSIAIRNGQAVFSFQELRVSFRIFLF